MKSIPVFLAMALLAMANAASAPQLKEGLWSVHTQTIDNPGNRKTEGTYKLCRNHAFDKSVEARAKDVKGCTMVKESFENGVYSSETHCVIGATVLNSHGTTVFQGDASLRSESHSTYTPALRGTSESLRIIDQKYEGSCPAGTQPGDRTGADGKIVHLWKH